MLVFSASDKGGTGRSVTSCNMAYWLSMTGSKVAYLDFDFGSPTAGGTFEIGKVDRGIAGGVGLHEFLLGETGEAKRLSVRSETDREELAESRHPSGRLVLFPGDRNGSEFTAVDPDMLDRCTTLLTKCESEFDVTFVDLSSGRSIALVLAMHATRQEPLRETTARWLVFHRWTRQHLIAASGLVFGEQGVLSTGIECGHDPDDLKNSIRYVRTAVPELNEPIGLRAAQATWLQKQNNRLIRSANKFGLGDSVVLGQTPMEPILQCREQVILDADVSSGIANAETVTAFRQLADRLVTDAFWEGLG
ncbi:SCO2523 family variant P-loop protein [Nocardia yamanashiensis]|uniref:SCO2523 family variant P-loop protein n=1 Tax=Nocardia yamanashiensis TaxID=209247 RepID=UPI00082BE2C8|nr:SCO2523 family variant P-loop protein [Nocardia yamanashiensis]